jgi:hypothetical protein
MIPKIMNGIFATGIMILLYSCSAKNISSNYYYEHEKVLEKIEQMYKELYLQKPFNIAFTDKAFRTVTVDIITDTLTYIYEFALHEPRLTDTLLKYNLSATAIPRLIDLMQSIRCTWVDNFDYYVDDQKRSLILISIKPVAIHSLFSYKKYYILTFYSQPQHFDEDGRLLDKRQLRRLRKINGEVFYRINDKVCYTVSGQFR